jgi:hypothetical protein
MAAYPDAFDAIERACRMFETRRPLVPVASQRLDDWCEAPLQDPFVEHTARFDALFETLPRCPAGASCALRF